MDTKEDYNFKIPDTMKGSQESLTIGVKVTIDNRKSRVPSLKMNVQLTSRSEKCNTELSIYEKRLAKQEIQPKENTTNEHIPKADVKEKLIDITNTFPVSSSSVELNERIFYKIVPCSSIKSLSTIEHDLDDSSSLLRILVSDGIPKSYTVDPTAELNGLSQHVFVHSTTNAMNEREPNKYFHKEGSDLRNKESGVNDSLSRICSEKSDTIIKEVVIEDNKEQDKLTATREKNVLPKVIVTKNEKSPSKLKLREDTVIPKEKQMKTLGVHPESKKDDKTGKLTLLQQIIASRSNMDNTVRGLEFVTEILPRAQTDSSNSRSPDMSNTIPLCLDKDKEADSMEKSPQNQTEAACAIQDTILPICENAMTGSLGDGSTTEPHTRPMSEAEFLTRTGELAMSGQFRSTLAEEEAHPNLMDRMSMTEGDFMTFKVLLPCLKSEVQRPDNLNQLTFTQEQSQNDLTVRELGKSSLDKATLTESLESLVDKSTSTVSSLLSSQVLTDEAILRESTDLTKSPEMVRDKSPHQINEVGLKELQYLIADDTTIIESPGLPDHQTMTKSTELTVIEGTFVKSSKMLMYELLVVESRVLQVDESIQVVSPVMLVDESTQVESTELSEYDPPMMESVKLPTHKPTSMESQKIPGDEPTSMIIPMIVIDESLLIDSPEKTMDEPTLPEPSTAPMIESAVPFTPAVLQKEVLPDQEPSTVPMDESAVPSEPAVLQKEVLPDQEPSTAPMDESAVPSEPAVLQKEVLPDQEPSTAPMDESAVPSRTAVLQKEVLPDQEPSTAPMDESAVTSEPAVLQPEVLPDQEPSTAPMDESAVPSEPAVLQQKVLPDQEPSTAPMDESAVPSEPAILQQEVLPGQEPSTAPMDESAVPSEPAVLQHEVLPDYHLNEQILMDSSESSAEIEIPIKLPDAVEGVFASLSPVSSVDELDSKKKSYEQSEEEKQASSQQQTSEVETLESKAEVADPNLAESLTDSPKEKSSGKLDTKTLNEIKKFPMKGQLSVRKKSFDNRKELDASTKRKQLDCETQKAALRAKVSYKTESCACKCLTNTTTKDEQEKNRIKLDKMRQEFFNMKRRRAPCNLAEPGFSTHTPEVIGKPMIIRNRCGTNMNREPSSGPSRNFKPRMVSQGYGKFLPSSSLQSPISRYNPPKVNNLMLAAGSCNTRYAGSNQPYMQSYQPQSCYRQVNRTTEKRISADKIPLKWCAKHGCVHRCLNPN